MDNYNKYCNYNRVCECFSVGCDDSYWDAVYDCACSKIFDIFTGYLQLFNVGETEALPRFGSPNSMDVDVGKIDVILQCSKSYVHLKARSLPFFLQFVPTVVVEGTAVTLVCVCLFAWHCLHVYMLQSAALCTGMAIDKTV